MGGKVLSPEILRFGVRVELRCQGSGDNRPRGQDQGQHLTTQHHTLVEAVVLVLARGLMQYRIRVVWYLISPHGRTSESAASGSVS